MVFWQEWLFQTNNWLSSLGYLAYPAFTGIYLLATLNRLASNLPFFSWPVVYLALFLDLL